MKGNGILNEPPPPPLLALDAGDAATLIRGSSISCTAERRRQRTGAQFPCPLDPVERDVMAVFTAAAMLFALDLLPVRRRAPAG